MPRISIWFVRTALLYCGAGFAAGAYQLTHTAGYVAPPPGWMRTFHIEGLLVGWMAQLAFGVAIWILPFSRAPSSDKHLWAAWAMLNGGIAATVVGRAGGFDEVYLIGGFGIAGACGLLAWRLWPRLRALPTRTNKHHG